MAKKINQKCKSCSLLKFSNHDNLSKDVFISPLPDCYVGKVCQKKRSYYRRHDHYKRELIKTHRYLKYKCDKCSLCGSSDRLEVHHVDPKCLNGADARYNCLTMCHNCHSIITKYYNAIGIGRSKYV